VLRVCILVVVAAMLVVVHPVIGLDVASTKVEASPTTTWSVEGCPLLGTRTLAAKIFGSYEMSGGGGRDFPPGRTMNGYLPAGAGIVECGFVRKWDAQEQSATPDSDILLSGFGKLSDPAALSETWNNLIARLTLHPSRHGNLHFAERPGFVMGYRDGLNTIAYAYWMVNMQGEFDSVPASRLRPLVTTIVCAGHKC